MEQKMTEEEHQNNTAKTAAPSPPADSITAREEDFIREFSELGDWMLQYEYLLYYIEDIHEIPEEERTDILKVRGCVSNAWLRLSAAEPDSIQLELTSDALIIKGILGVITAIIANASKSEIAQWNPAFIEKTALQSQLSIDRQKGISSILTAIQDFCRS